MGEVGIGKSRLWHEWSAGLAPDAVVLESRCLDATQPLPFAPLTDLFTRHLCFRRLFAPDSPVSRIWLAEIARLLPEIRAVLPDLPVPSGLPAEEERGRLFEAFAQWLLAHQAHPLVLFIDDLHWADRATLDWLRYLVHRLRDQVLLLVVAYRPDEAPNPLVHLTAHWVKEEVARPLPVARLTPEESAALIGSLGVDPMLAHHLQAQGAGNPYFLVELARAGFGDVPPVLTDLVRARLDRLPDAARQVLQAASVLEPDFDFATLRRTSGRDEEETLDALGALLDAAVLVERSGQYGFVHPLVAAVVRDHLSGARRAFLYRRAASALEATHADRLAHIAGRLAAYHAEAGDPGRAAAYAEMAAERALGLAAPDEATSFYQQALALEPNPTRQLELSRVLLRQGEMVAARAAFDAAMTGFEAVGDRRAAARVCLSVTRTYFAAGRVDEGRRWMERSPSYFDPASDTETRAVAHASLDPFDCQQRHR